MNQPRDYKWLAPLGECRKALPALPSLQRATNLQCYHHIFLLKRQLIEQTPYDKFDMLTLKSTTKQGFHNRSPIFKQGWALAALLFIPEQPCNNRIIPTLGHLRITQTFFSYIVILFNQTVSKAMWPPYEQKTPRTIPSIEELSHDVTDTNTTMKSNIRRLFAKSQASHQSNCIWFLSLRINSHIDVTQLHMNENMQRDHRDSTLWQGPFDPHKRNELSKLTGQSSSCELWRIILHFTWWN